MRLRPVYALDVPGSPEQCALRALLSALGVEVRPATIGATPPPGLLVLVPSQLPARDVGGPAAFSEELEATARQGRLLLPTGNMFLTFVGGRAWRLSHSNVERLEDLGLIVARSLRELLFACRRVPEGLPQWRVEKISSPAILPQLRYLLHEVSHQRHEILPSVQQFLVAIGDRECSTAEDLDLDSAHRALTAASRRLTSARRS